MACYATVCSARVAAVPVKAAVQAPTNRLLAFKRASISAGLAAVISAGSVAPALAADLVLGAEVFNNNCAACHNAGLNTVQNEKTLKKSALEQYLDGGFNVDAITYQVVNGKNAMPAWGDRLDEDEIEAVAAYVFDQATGEKW